MNMSDGHHRGLEGMGVDRRGSQGIAEDHMGTA